VLYCTVLYSAVLYCTVLCCAVLCCTVLYCTVLYCTVPYCTVLCCTVLYSTLLCCTVLYCTVLCCAVLCCTVLYCVQIVTLCSVVCSGGPLNWWSQAISYQIKWCHISEDTYLSSQSPCLYYWRKIDKAIFLQLSLTVFTQNFRKMAKLI